jgi:hypothetical protein
MELENKINAFLKRQQAGTKKCLAELSSNFEQVFLFGGAIRDIALSGEKACPRDLDLVIVGAPSDALEKMLREYIVRRTSFGGLKLRTDDTWIDLWRLEDTWAFQQKLVQPSPENLPQTTFLTSQAVAVEICGDTIGRVFEKGFRRSLNLGVLEPNLAENPFPALSIVRAIVIARKLHFAFSNSLRQHLLNLLETTTRDELVDAQRSHYGRRLIDAEFIRDEIASLSSESSTEESQRTGQRVTQP